MIIQYYCLVWTLMVTLACCLTLCFEFIFVNSSCRPCLCLLWLVSYLKPCFWALPFAAKGGQILCCFLIGSERCWPSLYFEYFRFCLCFYGLVSNRCLYDQTHHLSYQLYLSLIGLPLPLRISLCRCWSCWERLDPIPPYHWKHLGAALEYLCSKTLNLDYLSTEELNLKF